MSKFGQVTQTFNGVWPINGGFGGISQTFGSSQNGAAPAAWSCINHEHHTANGFKSLSAYIRSLLRTEPNCQCTWCQASELERQVAIAQFFKEEPEGEPEK